MRREDCVRTWDLASFIAVSLAAASGCGSSSPVEQDAGVPPEGLAEYDSTATLLRGPWLTPAGPGAIVVSWSTDQPARSRVEYGPDPAYGTAAHGTVAQPAPEGPAEPATAGWQHRVTLTGLAEDTAYRYRVVSLAVPTADATLRTPGAADGSFGFTLMGDVRTGDDEHQHVVDAILLDAPQLVLHTGDLTAVGMDESLWTTFFAIEAPLLASAAFLPVYGNHEDLLGRTLFDTYFPPPPGARSPRTYSADWGGVHVSVIDSYQSTLADEALWLDQDLATSAAQAARLRVVALHAPLYTFSSHAPDLAARATLGPVIKARDVALVVAGHNHLYERFFVDGVHHVVTGGGGAPLYGADLSVIVDEAGLERAAASQHHYVNVQVDAAGFRFEARPVPADAPLDCFVIDPQRPGAELPCT
ncbi:MAG: metallophosphoesterase family protein [Deltaproteobacteria bacterium]|nr:metallophosphoesterase family protein [Deltaproteobacteria bacterium]